MKKLICLLLVAFVLPAITACGVIPGDEPASGSAGQQTAAATLDQDGNSIYVTVDLRDGWSVEFARGAIYLYDGETNGNLEAAAIGVTLDKEVYDEYYNAAVDDESFKEVEGGVFYTESDGTMDYLSKVGGNAYFLLSVDKSADGDAVYARVQLEAFDTNASFYDESELYSPEEMDSAIALIAEEFATWNGCELHSINYAGDECNSEENIQWMNQLKEGKNYRQCIEFLTDFHSPTEEKDLEGTAWEADQEYEDYQWWLAREDGDEWELLTWGY
ncbi:MAG: hypothetical protein K6B40_06520 [Firmicutes bacterium]|nr:hypothetical protein [Bacillota bacterium]